MMNNMSEIFFHACFNFLGKNCQTNSDDCAAAPASMASVWISSTAFTARVMLGLMEICVITTSMNVPATPATMEVLVMIASMGSSANVRKVTTICTACRPSTNAKVPHVSMEGVCQDGVNEYSCACVAGYTGSNCETDIDECASNPCQHGGTCASGLDFFNCTCVAGYTGLKCEMNIDDCESTPCNNGGTCIDEVNGFRCVCSEMYTGLVCEEQTSPCENNQCQNGATCLPYTDYQGYSCQCAPGFQGKKCTVTNFMFNRTGLIWALYACWAAMDAPFKIWPQSRVGGFKSLRFKSRFKLKL